MKQQELRCWARDHINADDVVILTPAEARALSAGIAKSLSALDGFWSLASGREMTEEEKFGNPLDVPEDLSYSDS